MTIDQFNMTLFIVCGVLAVVALVIFIINDCDLKLWFQKIKSIFRK